MKSIIKNKFLMLFLLFILFLFFICSSNSSYCATEGVTFTYNGTTHTVMYDDFNRVSQVAFFEDGTDFDFFIMPANVSLKTEDVSFSKVHIFIYKGIKPYMCFARYSEVNPTLIFLDNEYKGSSNYYDFYYDLDTRELEYYFYGNIGHSFTSLKSGSYNEILEQLKDVLKKYCYCSTDIYTYNKWYTSFPENELVFQQTPVTVGKVTIPEITQVGEIPHIMNKVLAIIIPIGLIVFLVGLLIYLVRLVISRMT